MFRRRKSWEVASSLFAVVIASDDGGTIRHANDKLCELLGHPVGALDGKPLNVLIPERSRAVHDGHRSAYMHNPATRPMGPDREVYIRKADGSELRVWIGLSPTEKGLVVAAIMLAPVEFPGPLNEPSQ